MEIDEYSQISDRQDRPFSHACIVSIDPVSLSAPFLSHSSPSFCSVLSSPPLSSLFILLLSSSFFFLLLLLFLKVLREIKQSHPRSRPALSLMAYCHFQLQDFAEAATLYQTLSELYPEEVRRRRRGGGREVEGREKAAEEEEWKRDITKTASCSPPTLFFFFSLFLSLSWN